MEAPSNRWPNPSPHRRLCGTRSSNPLRRTSLQRRVGVITPILCFPRTLLKADRSWNRHTDFRRIRRAMCFRRRTSVAQVRRLLASSTTARRLNHLTDPISVWTTSLLQIKRQMSQNSVVFHKIRLLPVVDKYSFRTTSSYNFEPCMSKRGGENE